MKKKTKAISLILSICILLVSSVPAFAADTYGVADSQRYLTGDYKWAKDVLSLAVSAELFGGYPAKEPETLFFYRGAGWYPTKTLGELRPHGEITRAEFAAITVRALDLENAQYDQSPFADLKESAWYGKNVLRLIKAGVIAKDDYGTNMYPEKPITRLEIAVWMARAAKIAGVQNAPKAQLIFSDFNTSSKYATEVSEAVGLNILTGYPDKTFRPQKSASRAEAAVMLINMLKHAPMASGINKETVDNTLRAYFGLVKDIQKSWLPDYEMKTALNPDFAKAVQNWYVQSENIVTPYNREIRMHPEGLAWLDILEGPLKEGIITRSTGYMKEIGFSLAGTLPLKIAQTREAGAGLAMDAWYEDIGEIEITSIYGKGPIVEVEFTRSFNRTYIDGNTLPASAKSHVILIKQGGKWKIGSVFNDKRSSWLKALHF